MKRIFFSCLLILIFSCVEKEKEQKDETKKVNQTSSLWIDNFKKFRDAIYKKDKAKIKEFIDFPIINENNEIWILVYEGNERKIKSITKGLKPFTEKDFDIHFDGLFSKRFTQSILKIKTNELYKNKEFETIELPDRNEVYKMNAHFDDTDTTLTLSLHSELKVKNEEILDNGEYSIIYEFNILRNGKIKFKQIRLAG